jgi:DNA ligase-1
MRSFAEIAERIRSTSKKLEKKALLAGYFASLNQEDAAHAAVFFSGRPFPLWEETTLQAGASLLWRAISEISGRSEPELAQAYRKHGDVGAVAEAVLPERQTGELSLGEVERRFREIAYARGQTAKASLLRALFEKASPAEAKYIVKIMTGDLRIGLKESLVEEAIASAFNSPLSEVVRANMLLGDIGETLRLAAQGRLEQAKMRLFHPLGFMLASPAASSEDALSYFSDALIEDKYDGIRAQVHCSPPVVRVFSRTRDEITESFPELAGRFSRLATDAILDGEIVAWSYLGEDQFQSGSGQALPFSALQRRLGRKAVSDELMRQVPVAFLAFDVLYRAGELVIDRPLRERSALLEEVLQPLLDRQALATPARLPDEAQGRLLFDQRSPGFQAEVIRAPVYRASTPEELGRLFEAARTRGNEGLMIKDRNSLYTPGRRGKSWLKLKRELSTLDVVVTAVEYGHGKRIGVLSDYTFAVRDGERLLNVGKAYSGLTDQEIAEMTRWFLEHTIEDQLFRRVVEPKIVLEVAFNNIMKSDRHASGYALRFPRIVRLRPDKLPEEADTLERVKELYRQQGS